MEFAQYFEQEHGQVGTTFQHNIQFHVRKYTSRILSNMELNVVFGIMYLDI